MAKVSHPPKYLYYVHFFVEKKFKYMRVFRDERTAEQHGDKYAGPGEFEVIAYGKM